MILTVSLNPAIDKVAVTNKFNINNINRIKIVSCLPGGKGINVARCITNFGGKVTTTGFLGGKTGKIIKKLLLLEGISGKFWEINGETRTCLIVLHNDNCITEIYEDSPVIDIQSAIAYRDFFIKMADDFKHISISGSIPHSLPDNYILDLVQSFKGNLYLDITGVHLKNLLMYKSIFLLKLNKNEFIDSFSININKIENSILEVAHNFKIKNLIITLGEEGSLIYHDKMLFRSSCSKKVQAINPVGAGDVLLGTLMFHLTSGNSFMESCKSAIAASMSNVTIYEGGKVNFPVYQDLLNHIHFIRIL